MKYVVSIILLFNVCFIYSNSDGIKKMYSLIDIDNTEDFIKIYTNTNDLSEGESEDLLEYSIYKNSNGISKFIINNGTNVNIKSKYTKEHDYIAFNLSTEHNEELLSLLLKHNLMKDIFSEDGITLLNCIIYNNSMGILKDFINYGFSVNIADENDGETPLEFAIGNDPQKAILLLNSGANIKNVSNNVKKYFIDYYCELAKVEDENWNNYYSEIANIILEKGLDPKKSLAIHTAVFYESYHFFVWLIAHDVDRKMEDNNGNIPIQRECGPMDMELFYIEKYPENYKLINEILNEK
jgi:ankyrin repeat protein